MHLFTFAQSQAVCVYPFAVFCLANNLHSVALYLAYRYSSRQQEIE